jgi:hypothetical protein
MRKLVIASLLAIATFCTGCFTCGAFEGQANRVYQRDNEMLILCDNGGFVALLADRMVEGLYTYNADGSVTATSGEDSALAFEALQQGDALTAPQLGEASWTQLSLDKTALDHSNNLCNDLTYRTWWPQ